MAGLVIACQKAKILSSDACPKRSAIVIPDDKVLYLDQITEVREAAEVLPVQSTGLRPGSCPQQPQSIQLSSNAVLYVGMDRYEVQGPRD